MENKLNLLNWGIVSNNKGVYDKMIYPSYNTIRVLNAIFEHNPDISKYRLRFITWNQERARGGDLYYSLSGTDTWVPTLGTTCVYVGHIIGNPLNAYDLSIWVAVNDNRWNFEVKFADIPLKKSCKVEIINPTYNNIVEELGKAIDRLINE